MRDAVDRRRNVLELTGTGQAEFDSLVPGVRRVDAVLTARLDLTDQALLRRLLGVLLESSGPEGVGA